MKGNKKVCTIVVASLMICLNALHVVCTAMFSLDVLEATSSNGTTSDYYDDITRQEKAFTLHYLQLKSSLALCC